MQFERPVLIRIGVVAGGIDPRSVARVLGGKSTKAATRLRVLAALAELGIPVPREAA